MLTPASTSQSRITRNDPVVVLNVRVWLRRPPRGPGVRTQTVNDSLPTSKPATRSNMTSMSPPFRREATIASRRRSGGTSARTQTRVLSWQQSSGNRDPRAIHLHRARPHQCVSTSPADPPILISQCSDSKSATDYTRCTVGRSAVGMTARTGLYPLWVGVTMSLHKLTAGSGYDYLTRQVAALDATEKGHTGLASYY